MSLKSIQVVPEYTGYGADKLVSDIHRVLLKDGLESYIICLTNKFPSDIPSTLSLGLKSPYSIDGVLRLSRAISEMVARYPDSNWIVHTHLTSCQYYTPIALKLSGLRIPVFTTEHSTYNRRRKMFFGKLMDYCVFKQYDKIVCISNAVKVAFGQWQPCLKNKLITIENGIDLDKFNISTRTENDETPVIVSSGRLEVMKNYDTAIQACALLRNMSFEYHILGDGSLRPTIEQLITELDLANKVKLVGFVPNVHDYLKKSQIFLMPSKWEGFGLAALEAMACGIPVLASDVPGLRDLVGSDEQCGYLINPTCSQDIANKLRKLIKDRELRLCMGKRGRARSEEYSIEKTAKRYIELYERTLAEYAC